MKKRKLCHSECTVRGGVHGPTPDTTWGIWLQLIQHVRTGTTAVFGTPNVEKAIQGILDYKPGQYDNTITKVFMPGQGMLEVKYEPTRHTFSGIDFDWTSGGWDDVLEAMRLCRAGYETSKKDK